MVIVFDQNKIKLQSELGHAGVMPDVRYKNNCKHQAVTMTTIIFLLIYELIISSLSETAKSL